jgi:hypothetical protein
MAFRADILILKWPDKGMAPSDAHVVLHSTNTCHLHDLLPQHVERWKCWERRIVVIGEFEPQKSPLICLVNRFTSLVINSLWRSACGFIHVQGKGVAIKDIGGLGFTWISETVKGVFGEFVAIKGSVPDGANELVRIFDALDA